MSGPSGKVGENNVIVHINGNATEGVHLRKGGREGGREGEVNGQQHVYTATR